MTRSTVLGLLLMVGAGACSAADKPRHLEQAHALERSGDTEGAHQAYQRAQRDCANETNQRKRFLDCKEAYLGQAELYENQGNKEQAAQAYERIPALLPAHEPASAEATYRAGRLYLELGHAERGYTLLWRCVTNYPAEAFAGDAVKVLLRDGRKRAPDALATELRRLANVLAGHPAADNLLWALADLEEHELEAPHRALAALLMLIERSPKGGFIDDARWHAARLLRAQGKSERAVTQLEALLATREVAFGTGSYFSVWLDDAALERGRILRDDLQRPKKALAAFEQLARDYPASILIDDAMFESAVTLGQLGRKERACALLRKMAKQHPDSKYQIEKAPLLAGKLSC